MRLQRSPANEGHRVSLASPGAIFINGSPSGASGVIVVVRQLANSRRGCVNRAFANVYLSAMGLVRRLKQFRTSNRSSSNEYARSTSRATARLEEGTREVSIIVPRRGALSRVSVFRLRRVFSNSIGF